MTDDEEHANAQRDLIGGSLNLGGDEDPFAARWAKDCVVDPVGMNSGTDFSLWPYLIGQTKVCAHIWRDGRRMLTSINPKLLIKRCVWPNFAPFSQDEYGRRTTNFQSH